MRRVIIDGCADRHHRDTFTEGIPERQGPFISRRDGSFIEEYARVWNRQSQVVYDGVFDKSCTISEVLILRVRPTDKTMIFIPGLLEPLLNVGGHGHESRSIQQAD